MTRVAFFQANPRWTEDVHQAIRYAVSFSRRYAEHGDHEVSAAAVNAIVEINAIYVNAKGRTFFSYHSMIENPLTTDSFINDTLEHLRQTSRIAISRGDEQQIQQTLRAFAALVRVYIAIDYADPQASKTHAHLAAAYLTGDVERVVSSDLPDVLTEGVRSIGQCADMLLRTEGPNGIITLVQKLGVIGCCGIVKEDYRSVTLTCVEQLSRLTFDLLRNQSHDMRFAAEQIRSSMVGIAKIFLSIPDRPLTNTHSTYLAPYYSVTTSDALLARLADLVNAIVEAKSGDKNARKIVLNIERWADGLYRTEKDILLESISKRSHFTFDMIHWIKQATSALLAVSNAPVCDDYKRAALRRHALWLISTLSFTPDDIETVEFVENFQMTETLFESALDAYQRDCPNEAVNITALLVSWMFKGGKYDTGWAILERAVYGLAVLALLAESTGAIPKLKSDIGRRLAAGELSNQDLRDRVAVNIRGRAVTLYREGHFGFSIERGLAVADHAKLKPLLEELADLISPRTAGQAAEQHLV
jgi:hypothetical protein